MGGNMDMLDTSIQGPMGSLGGVQLQPMGANSGRFDGAGGVTAFAAANLHRLYRMNLDLDGSRDMRSHEESSIERECSPAAMWRCCGLSTKCGVALQGRYASHCCAVMLFDAEALLAAGAVGHALSEPTAAALEVLAAEARNAFSALTEAHHEFTPLFLATKVDVVRRKHANFHFPTFAEACAAALYGQGLRVTTAQVLEIRCVGSKADFAALLAQRDWDYVRSLYHKAFAAMLPVAASNMRHDKQAFCECLSLCI